MNANIKKNSWKVIFALALLGIAVALWTLHFLIFKDAYHLLFYILLDIAFVPISVLLVTLVLEHILEAKQKEAMFHKLNMALGTFFSEVGTPLLKNLDFLRTANPGVCSHLLIGQTWSQKDFKEAHKFLNTSFYQIPSLSGHLIPLNDFLKEKRSFLLLLLENPNLLEHEQITDMLWAIFHLAEELSSRRSLTDLSAADLAHLSQDIKRAYTHLVAEWLAYMEHLKSDYPYLFSLAVRTNPFDPQACVEIS